MAFNEMQVIAAARAIDRIGLRERGWTENEIDRAFRNIPTPADTSLKLARAALEATDNVRHN